MLAELRNQWLSAPDLDLLKQCEESRFRGSGKGGQKRNKTANAVQLTHGPSKLATRCEASRSLAQNRDTALAKLRLEILFHFRCPLDLDSPDLALILSRKPSRAQRKLPSFFKGLAELLDAFTEEHLSIADTATRLSVKKTAISRALAADPVVLRSVNEWRQQKGLSTLR